MRGWSRQGKDELRGTRRDQAKHTYIQEEMVVAEKIRSKDG